MLLVWFALNSLLTGAFLLDGSLIPALPRVAAYLPVLVLGLVVGELLHHRVDKTGFRHAVFAVLLFAGLTPASPQ